MISKQFKKLLQEQGSLYQIGNYPTSDQVNTMAKISEVDEWGCMFELADGSIVECSVTPLGENKILGSFHKDGSDAEIFDLCKTTSKYFNEFKKKIEKKYEQNLIDEDRAKKQFNKFISKIFNN